MTFYSELTFGEAISIFCRHKLCLLCLEEIQKNFTSMSESDEPKDRGRGRPRSASSILANQVDVTYDTVKRWQDPEAIQACNANAVKLARLAFTYNPEETIKILRQDLERHREAVEVWISQRTSPAHIDAPDIVAGACVENTEIEEGA